MKLVAVCLGAELISLSAMCALNRSVTLKGLGVSIFWIVTFALTGTLLGPVLAWLRRKPRSHAISLGVFLGLLWACSFYLIGLAATEGALVNASAPLLLVF